MNAVTLTIRSVPPQSLDASELLPHTLVDQTESQIAALPLPMGRQPTQVGDWFEVQVKTAAPAEVTLRLVGDCRRLDFIGQGLRGGSLIVEGNVGNALGHRMQSGSIHVLGSAGDHVGMSMRGGQLSLDGNAGEYVAGPAAGERSGMSGGQISIRGNVGSHLGYRLRRGTLLVGGHAAAFAAAEMVAGTIAIGGTVGTQLAIGMRRGTVLLCQSPALPRCGFTEPRLETPSVHPLLVNSLCRMAGQGTPFSDLALSLTSGILRSIGDRAVSGMGEVLWPG